ncbi:hypothetical protein [Nocardia aurea]|uniref:hypothetical protein n=1 Tax=Nocardia aurea TaxID=2144174 RepID=UPI0033BB3DFE
MPHDTAPKTRTSPSSSGIVNTSTAAASGISASTAARMKSAPTTTGLRRYRSINTPAIRPNSRYGNH